MIVALVVGALPWHLLVIPQNRAMAVGHFPSPGRDATLSHMLFHITQVHAPEDCPYGTGGSRKFHDSSVSEVTVHGVYGAFMGAHDLHGRRGR